MALAVVTGKTTLQKVQARFRSTAEYYQWFFQYYVPLAEAKKQIDTLRYGGVAVALGAQMLTNTIQTILKTTQQEMATWTAAQRKEFSSEAYDWQIPELNQFQKPAVIQVFNIIDKYVADTGWDAKGTPEIWASVNQLKQAETALLKYDKTNSGKKVLAVLFGILKLEDF